MYVTAQWYLGTYIVSPIYVHICMYEGIGDRFSIFMASTNYGRNPMAAYLLRYDTFLDHR